MNVDFPAPGAPEMPDAHRAAAARQDLGEQRLGLGAVIGAGRLDQRDRARERAPVTVDQLAREPSSLIGSAPADVGVGGVRRGAAGRRSRRRRLRDVGAGTEDRGDAGVAQLVVVLRGDHAAGDHEDVVAALLAQLRDELGDERLVPGGLARHADDVHVVLDRVARRLLGRLEQRADVDVEAEVGERGGDHLGAAVVAVLAELRRRACAGGGPRAAANSSTAARTCCVALVALVGRAVHARDATDRRPVPGEHLLDRVGDLADRRACPGRLDRELEQVAVAGARPRAARRARPGTRLRRAFARDCREPRELLLAHARRCRRRGRRRRPSSASRYLLTPTITSSPRSMRGLAARRRLLDAQLRHARLDGLGHAAERLDLLDQLPRLVGEARR